MMILLVLASNYLGKILFHNSIVFSLIFFFFFSDRTKSVSNFENNFFNFAHDEKIDNEKQNVKEITSMFEYVLPF